MEVLAEKKPIEEQVDCNIDINIFYHFNKGFGLFRAPYFEQLSCNQDFYIDKEELICIQYPAM